MRSKDQVDNRSESSREFLLGEPRLSREEWMTRRQYRTWMKIEWSIRLFLARELRKLCRLKEAQVTVKSLRILNTRDL
jgi:hypothetical protein